MRQYFTSSMRRYRGLRGPSEKHLLLLFTETRGVIERGVVSGRHRTAADGLRDALQLVGSFLRIVSLPIGKIEHAARRVGGEVGRRNGRIPRRAPAGRMTLITGALENRVHLLVVANRVRRRRSRRLGSSWCGT